MVTNNFEVGRKIKFQAEKQRYTIIGKTDRYLICIKPFNARRTYMYTIVDLVEQERGPDHWLLGNYCYEDTEDVVRCLKDLVSGECKLSPRRSIPLDLEVLNER